MTSQDPFEILAGSCPTEPGDRVEFGDDPAVDALLRSIMSEPAPDSRRRRRRRRWVSGVVATAVVGTGAVAAAVWLDRPADPTLLSCYSDAAVPPAIQVGLMIDPTLTPIEQCTPQWHNGELGSEGPPELAACVSSEGIAIVLPGSIETCNELGLAGLDPDRRIGDLTAIRVANLHPERYEDQCFTSEEAMDVTQQIFDEVGADDWTVEVLVPVTDELPCAIPSILGAEQRVLLAAGSDFR